MPRIVPRKRKSAKSKSSSRRKANLKQRPGSECPVSAQVYRGPVVPRSTLEANTTDTVLLVYQTTLTSTAGGVIATVFGNAPNSAANWADWNTVEGEYRCLGMQVEFIPNNRYSKVSTTCRMLCIDDDRRSSTALASYAAATSRPSCRKLSLEDPWKHAIHMAGAEESQFVAVSAPASVSWIKTYADGLSINTEYGIVLVYYLVQFRNIE